MSISNLVASPTSGKPPPRQRRTRPEVVAVTIERVEHLLLEVRKTDGAPSLVIEGLDERIAALEDAKVPAVTLRDHDTRLHAVEEALRSNGHDREAA
jgi:hypothetical protein